jgi:adenosylhomocysteine nucleosidase
MAPILVLISANSEWRAVKENYPDRQIIQTPFGESFELNICEYPLILVHGGWGKISAAASTQYAIQTWNPELVINLGTCGGIRGAAQKGEIILAESTLVYDIVEQMGDPEEALHFYTTSIDLSWMGPPEPIPVRKVRMLSADRDILPAEIPMLEQRFQAVSADWESGAIAWVTSHNHLPCLILRGISDVVGNTGGEAYGALEVFHLGTDQVMKVLLDSLPGWVEMWDRSKQLGFRPEKRA